MPYTFQVVISLILIMLIFVLFICISHKQNFNILQSETWKKENTFIFLILGDCANIEQVSGFKGDKKYINYSLFSDAVLIKRLATKHLKIDPEHIVIFAHGTKNDFNFMSTKVYSQLTPNEIYKTVPEQDDFNFIYYQKTSKIHEIISSKLKGHQDAHIILFLDDHGSPVDFGNSPFFDFYMFFLKIKHSALYILNDSCYSGSMIDILENYFKISEVLKRSKNNISTADLHFISFISNQLQPDNTIKDLNYIFSFIEKCCHYEKKEEFLYEIISNLYESLEKLNINSNEKLKDIIIPTETSVEHFKNNISILSKVGIKTFKDLQDFYQFIYYFQSLYGKSNFKSILIKINPIIRITQNIQKSIRCDNKKLYQIIKELISQDQFFTNTLYDRHQNHYIITSSHKDGLAPTFGTRRINSDTKIIPGSPAMSAFIIEALMFPKKDGISINRIKCMAYETKHYYKEYAIQSYRGKKKWIRLFFTEWESSPHANKSFFDLNLNLDQTNIENIMKSIGFSLSVKFEDDLETPIDLINKENGEKTPEKYGFIIQPRKKREKRKRYRTIDKKQKSLFNGYTNMQEEKDEYYSDDESGIKSNKSDESNTKSSNFVLATINYNEKIDINLINNFKENIYTHHEDFFPDFIFVFRYELQELTKDMKYPFNPNDNYDVENYDKTMNVDILIWISHFFSPWYIRFVLNDILSQIGTYIHKYKIPLKIIEDLFKRSFNVADQIVTPIYFKRESFKVDRLTNC